MYSANQDSVIAITSGLYVNNSAQTRGHFRTIDRSSIK